MVMYKFLTAVIFVVLFSVTPGIVKAEHHTYHKTTTKNGEHRYTFTGKSKPRLIVQQGKNCDALSVNIALEKLNLPPVSKGGTVQSLLRGQRSHMKRYVWDSPSYGTLTVVSAQCENQSGFYECIWQVIVSS